MNLTIKESMEKEIYEVSNVMGMAIECYPFKGSITDSREKEVQMDGVGFTIYNAEVSLDEDGCLFVGLTNAQALKLAACLSDIVFNPKVNCNESKQD